MHYHADNGVFAARRWVEDCYKKGQGMTFAATNAHHQNGKAEIRIKHLQDQARTMLIHATKRWPEAINAHLWPYAMRMACDSINSTPWPSHPNSRTPQQIFSNTLVEENPKHWFHFGCPAYVLDENLQQGRRPKGGKVDVKGKNWCVLREIPPPLKKCGPSIKHKNGKSIPTVPCTHGPQLRHCQEFHSPRKACGKMDGGRSLQEIVKDRQK